MKGMEGFLREFRRRWSAYMLIAMIPAFIMMQMVLPFYQWLSRVIISNAGIPFITHNSLPQLLISPMAMALLAALLVLLLFTLLLQFSITLIGVDMVCRDEVNLKDLFRRSFSVLKRTGFKALLPVFIYFLLFLPLAGLILRSTIFEKILIPQYTFEYIYAHIPFAIAGAAVYLIFLFISVSRIYTLPLMILKEMPFEEALYESRRRMKGKTLRTGIAIIVIALGALFLSDIIYALIYVCQTFWDEFFANAALIAAIANLSLIQIISTFFSAMVCLVMLFIVMPWEEDIETYKNREIGKNGKCCMRCTAREAADDEGNYTREISGEKSRACEMRVCRERTLEKSSGKYSGKAGKAGKTRKTGVIGTRRIFAICIIIYVAAVAAVSAWQLVPVQIYNPLVIAHRGRDGANGVQNTIEALEATVDSAHPDYVEIDIHETKDGEFVVYHDENFNRLCGVNATPHDLTLRECTKLTAKQNGFEAQVPSFDDYLAKADELGQKLLIEIKTSPYDSEDMLDRFTSKYGEYIIGHGHILHSMDYKVTEYFCGKYGNIGDDGINVDGRHIETGTIILYNIIYPETNAAFHTFQYKTVDSGTITQARVAGQGIYVWTVNDADAMDKMLALKIDGIITDNPSLLRDEIEKMTKNPTFAERLRIYSDLLSLA